MLPICTMFSMRVRASRAVFAWMVDMLPSWPVFIACSMSNASLPRTSPTMMRSGRMRSALRTRSRCVTSPRPSRLATGFPAARRAAAAAAVRPRPRWSRCARRYRSVVTVRSAGWSCPEPVPPEMITLRRARAPFPAAGQPAGSSCRIRSAWRKSILWRANLRIEIYGPSSASGGNTMLTREPSFSRASTIGCSRRCGARRAPRSAGRHGRRARHRGNARRTSSSLPGVRRTPAPDR